jgi:acyl-coenzyme A thioesterase PaaI-like protein
LFSKLPSAFFAGVRVREIDEKKCVVTVPYKWFSQNPFRSTYFACLSMAAEMSTGALSMTHLYKRKPPVSMLVVKVESEYFKKATGRTTFVCEDGEMIQKAIGESIATGEARMVRARSVGKNKEGEVVAEFFITWSFKVKSKSTN